MEMGGYCSGHDAVSISRTRRAVPVPPALPAPSLHPTHTLAARGLQASSRVRWKWETCTQVRMAGKRE